MANDHVIDVKVKADTTGLSKGLTDAEQGLSKAGQGFSKYGSEAEKAGKASQGFVEKNKAHMESAGKDAMIMGGAILAGVGVAIAAYSEFSSRMAQVQSLSHASAGEMDVLTKSALTMGTAFGLSANEVADAEIELVKAGVSVKDMIGGALPGALALAAAGQIDVGKATEIATIALTQFNLSGKDVPHVADLLAAGADKALGGVQELGYGLKQGGLIAAQFGLSIDDTVGTLSAFANAGLLGADAGTSMKTMFLSLASPSKQAQKVLDEYKISAYDSQGAFVGVTNLAGQLHDKLGNLSDAQRNAALSTIFGTDAMRAASVLMKEGSTGIQKWITDVNDQGFAAQQAAGKMDSLNGDFKKLQASFETGLIKMGSTADGALRPVVQGITNMINGFSNLDPSMQKVIMTGAGLAGGTLLVGGALLTTIPKIYETVKAVEALKAASPNAASALASLGKVALPVAAALTALLIGQRIADSLLPAQKSVQELTQKLLALQGGAAVNDIFGKDLFARANNGVFGVKGIVEDTNSIGDAIKRLNDLSFSDHVNDFMNGFIDLGGKLPELRKSLTGVDSALSGLASSGSGELAATNFHKIAVAAEKQGVSLDTVSKSFPQYMESVRKSASDMGVFLNDQELLDLAVGRIPQKMKDAQSSTEGQAKATELAAKASAEQAKALSDVGLNADGTTASLDKLVTAMVNSGLIQLSSNDALRNYYASLDAVDASIKQNGKSLDIHTEKGRANQKALDDVAGSTLALVKANAKNGDSQEELSKTLHTGYDDLMANYAAFGITGDAADDLARKTLGIPKGVPIDVAIQNFADAMAKLNGIRQGVEAIRDYKEVAIHVNYTESGTAIRDRASDAGTAGASVQAYASGGAVFGSGSKGVDSVRSVLAPGEHVLSDSDVDAMGGQAAVYAFRKQLHSGGGVRPMYAAAAPSAPVMTQMSNGGDMQMTGTLVLDSGEVMGTFRGIARQEAAGAVNSANTDANRRAAR